MVQLGALTVMAALSLGASALVTRQVTQDFKIAIAHQRQAGGPPEYRGQRDCTPIRWHPELAARSGDKTKRDILGGFDDREIPPHSGYPYKTMGKVFHSNGAWCSGVLVGPRHVATARYCIPGPGISVRFVPYSFGGGEPFGGSQVTIIYTVGDWDVHRPGATACDWKEDWAIFILADRLGDRQEYMGATTVEVKYVNQPIYENFGYPGDLNSGIYPYRQDDITIRGSQFGCDQYGPIDTDTDSYPGQSGGPLWREGDGLVIGVFSGLSAVRSIFAGGPNYFGGVVSSRRDFP